MKQPKVRNQIVEAHRIIRALMLESLRAIGDDMVTKVMRKWRSATPAKRINSIKDITPSGVVAYKQALLSAMAVIAHDALKQARSEVPSKSKIKLMEDEESLQLGEFEKLPPKVRNRLNTQAQSIVDKQIGDLQGAVNFQFQHSVDSAELENELTSDLTVSVGDYADGAAVDTGASTMASQIVNESRNAFFFDDQVLEQIEAFVFENGDPVSPICEELAGTVFAPDDPNISKYQPPLHFRCKSYITAVLKGNLQNALDRNEQTGIESLKASKKAERSIQFGEAASSCEHCGRGHDV